MQTNQLIEKVRKRNGVEVIFNQNKITNAIKRAYEGAGEKINEQVVTELSNDVVENLILDHPNQKIFDVEAIQDEIEHVLIEAMKVKVVRAFIKYRYDHQKNRVLESSKVIVDNYLKKLDWRVKENSNCTPSVGALGKYITGEVSKDYWLREVLPPEVTQEYLNGTIHIHDLSSGLLHYCSGYSLKTILLLGVCGIPNIPVSAPAKHFDSILNQIANLTTIYQNEQAGAVAYNSFDTLLAPFVKKDQLTDKQIRQSLQNFIYSINSNSRGGAEPAFSNLSFDLTVPEDMRDTPAVIGGEDSDITYGECQAEADRINQILCRLMIDGDSNGRPFAYPVVTYNITKDFDWDNHNLDILFEMAAKYGYPYFSNYINSDMKPSDARSMCPLDGSTLIGVLRVNNDNGEVDFVKQTIREVYLNREKYLYRVFNGETYVEAKPIQTEDTATYTITCENGKTIIFGENHIQPTEDADYFAKDLTVGMKLPFFKKHSVAVEDTNKWSNYELSPIVEIKYNMGLSNLFCLETQDDKHLFVLSNGLLTHNCRLRLDLRELRKRNGGLFGSGDAVGSVSVTTINLPHIAYLTKGNKEVFYKELTRICDIAAKCGEVRREWLTENILNAHLIPAFETYVGSYDNYFTTIGVIGMSEMCENFFGKGIDITTEQGHKFAIEVGNFIRDRLLIYQNQYGHLFNYEATPAESTCYKLAKHDLEQYPDIITQGTPEAPYYTNSCHIPVKLIKSIKDTFDNQNDLQIQFTGGTVIHIYTNSAITTEAAKNIIRTCCENYQAPYISISPLNRYCDKHGYIQDAVDNCPICGEPVHKYQRITGYLRCVDNFNPGKTSEFNDRVQLNIKE